MDRQLSEDAVDNSSRLRVPSARIAADVVDGEVVVINLDTGSYYSTDGIGCDAWVLLASGRTLGEVVDVLRDRYDAQAGEVEEYVRVLVGKIVADGLMLPASDSDVPVDVGAVPLPPIAARLPFEPADFVGYDDMKGLLLLDPVHEVDDRGWPHASAGG